MSGYIYHERQLGGLCGVHCLNNLLQGPYFGPGDLAEIGVQLDHQEQALVRQNSQGDAPEAKPYNVDSSADGGNFSIQVLSLALKRFKLELMSSRHPDAKQRMKDPASAAEAFLCQYRDHWFAIRQVADCWWNLNSTRKRPAMVGPFYLAAWLSQLGAEGYTIFLVMGAPPEPAKPQSEEEHNLENFHDVFDLLERGKKSGGNPVMTDPDDEVVIPPDLEQEARQQQLPSDVQHPEMAFLQGLGLGTWGSYGPTGPVAHTFQGAASRPGRDSDVERSMLEVGRVALREMGFKEPQIAVALELGDRDGDAASELLLSMPPLDHAVEMEAAAWARAIQACVLGLDRRPAPIGALREGLLRLAALLSVDQGIQRAAREHVELSVLSDFLIKIMKHNSQDWAPLAISAGHIAEKLLSNAARRQRGEEVIDDFDDLHDDVKIVSL
eukprot:TRINITY_DN78125_c0_g1_i1.p1 TRINITY_DN78125_c0_g1~~TRINITY_DN78125_c0_g1_i1.p1  ORF type:complete len:464 (+),score=122.67 TRINITY_DN78125_c0_g1_i1:75-1394(+)